MVHSRFRLSCLLLELECPLPCVWPGCARRGLCAVAFFGWQIVDSVECGVSACVWQAVWRHLVSSPSLRIYKGHGPTGENDRTVRASTTARRRVGRRRARCNLQCCSSTGDRITLRTFTYRTRAAPNLRHARGAGQSVDADAAS